MKINIHKSTMLINELAEDVNRKAESLFPMQILDLDQGIKNLGFRLKPNSYHFEDWNWFYNKLDARISIWCNRWLSWGGRLVLVKSVLESIPVYWMTITKIF